MNGFLLEILNEAKKNTHTDTNTNSGTLFTKLVEYKNKLKLKKNIVDHAHQTHTHTHPNTCNSLVLSKHYFYSRDASS